MKPILAELFLSPSYVLADLDFQSLLGNPLNRAAITGFESPMLPDLPWELADPLPCLSHRPLICGSYLESKKLQHPTDHHELNLMDGDATHTFTLHPTILPQLVSLYKWPGVFQTCNTYRLPSPSLLLLSDFRLQALTLPLSSILLCHGFSTLYWLLFGVTLLTYI